MAEIILPDPDDFDRVIPVDTGYSDAVGPVYNLEGDFLTVGFGDGSTGGMYMSWGYSDPWTFGYDTPISARVYAEVDVPPESRFFSPSRYGDLSEVSQEGGSLLRLEVIGMRWPDGVYRVDLVADDGKVFPQLKPGMNSARFGQASQVRPEPGNRVLIAATPAAPVGTYTVRVTMPDTTVFEVGQVDLVYVPGCEALTKMVAVPHDVYRPRYPDKRDVQVHYPANFVGGVMYAFSKELQFLYGVPETSLLQDFGPDDAVLVPISTHGFADAGFLSFGDTVVEYSARSITEFTVVPGVRTKTYPAGTLVRPVLVEVTPVRYKRGS